MAVRRVNDISEKNLINRSIYSFFLFFPGIHI